MGPSGTLEPEGIRISGQNSDDLVARNDDSSGCFYCFNSGTSTQTLSFISYRDILHASSLETNTSDVHQAEITYVVPVESTVEVRKIVVHFPEVDLEAAEPIANLILKKAYPENNSKPSVLLLINPHGGKGEALHIYQKKILPIFQAANLQFTFKETEYSAHAVEIARELDVDKYDIVACCSGDGIPHEVINGFYQREDKGVTAFNKVAVTQLPCGSGNAMALSSYGSADASLCTFEMLKSKRKKLDLMAVTQLIDGSEVTKLSFLTQCLGAVADADIGTENLRWLGPIRFELGCIQKIFSRATYPCDLYVKPVTETKNQITKHYEYHAQNPKDHLPLLSKDDFVLNGPKLSEIPSSDWIKLPASQTDNLTLAYVSKLPYVSHEVQFFPAALPDDKAMDMILVDTGSTILEHLAVLTNTKEGKHALQDKIHHQKISSYRLVPKSKDPENHYLSVDGESFPFQTYQVELIPRALTILLPEGTFVDTHYSKQLFQKA
ncbi:uncharacterized protein CANTADRAFT_5863 [Suhomyces tanzawaensis NRRL Y-17324]|uniref:DAGKc domain-containing protein n=1 Tax=Suhomyces tanzawaensis NRRL Y-17324 TaxID=984487 RepID=A0A1E4SL13_9ASCO|nr:uncharacterized protein CANTADRAFT_5863 [Suhomyces tanzawaensis NRRL Y-17324]ODV80201.1 hypothetical protein CANTADRAFT_5863 [Suhomyces tanzawaensis NRRL Y-17324]